MSDLVSTGYERLAWREAMLHAARHVREHLDALRMEKRAAQDLNDASNQEAGIDVVDDARHDGTIGVLLSLACDLEAMASGPSPAWTPVGTKEVGS